MKFDKTFTLIGETKTSDGMGGWETVKGTVGTMKALTTPISAEIALKQHGIISTSAFKVITKDLIDDISLQLSLNGKSFKILQIADYGKYRMLLVEVI